MGNRGVIQSGDVQWMTAGSGVIHEEMPSGNERGEIAGFQLWANLPASEKMTSPRYRDVKSSEIPVLRLDNGVEIRIICGRYAHSAGPISGIAIDPEYLDITLPPAASFTHRIPDGRKAFAYVIGGKGLFCNQDEPFGYDTEGVSYFDMESPALLENETLVLFGDGESISIATGKDPLRILLISGNPLNEPVAWHGPIVMNTREELRQAFEEFHNGTFIRRTPS
jgi:hypothetical protein